MDECTSVDGRAEWAQVVMVANSLKFTLLAVEKETFIGYKL